MEKMWAGRFSKEIDKLADDFNSSIHFDSRMYRQDIKGSIAHASMLGACGIISKDDSELIINTLCKILEELDNGGLKIDFAAEDIHMFIEGELTKRIGDVGKRLHTARSRNDQVALDIRLYLRDESEEIKKQLLGLIAAINDKAKENVYTILPGYTHLQRAQPISFAHHLLAYAQMFKRDVSRLVDATARMNYSPLGSCALSGTTYSTDRGMVADSLGFSGSVENSIDGVSDRDFCIEFLSCFSTVMMHLSRFSEEIILWSSWEFKFVELDDSYTTGSSIMPQKKNPDIAELVRGKCGRVYGDLMATLTMLKGLPLAYNKDMQEDKESIFDAIDTTKMCLDVFVPMLRGMKVLPENMLKAAKGGFINATDLADYLTKKGMPFRSAYKISGTIVADCIKSGKVLDEVTIEEYKSYSDIFDDGVYAAIDLTACVEQRISDGGTSFISVKKQISEISEYLRNEEENIY